jgi:hypothetical protein
MRATITDLPAGTGIATEMTMTVGQKEVLHPTGFILLSKNSVFTSRREEPP